MANYSNINEGRMKIQPLFGLYKSAADHVDHPDLFVYPLLNQHLGFYRTDEL